MQVDASNSTYRIECALTDKQPRSCIRMEGSLHGSAVNDAGLPNCALLQGHRRADIAVVHSRDARDIHTCITHPEDAWDYHYGPTERVCILTKCKRVVGPLLSITA